MKIPVIDCKTGVRGYRELTPSELAAMQAEQEAAESNYWLSVDYGDAINNRIRERYSDSQEFAILRQKDEKPEEYAEYYAYCEECKAYVKQMKAKWGV
jgi:SAM-dependent MidA family methyltransferase